MEASEQALIDDAKIALQRSDHRAAQILARRALMVNLQSASAWDILYQILGQDTPFGVFQEKFIARYFPGRQLPVAPVPQPAAEPLEIYQEPPVQQPRRMISFSSV